MVDSEAPMNGPWKVGELAKATGITVRALHHYHELGLLTPSGRTNGGHRLYTKGDLERLQHIMGLRQLGFSLDQITGALQRPDASPLSTIGALRQDLQRRRAEIDDLDERLESVERRLVSGGEVSTEHLLQLIERMAMFDTYLTRDQLAKIKAQAASMSPERAREAYEKDWPALVAAVRAEEARGTDPADPKVQALAQRWAALTEEVTGKDPAIAASMLAMYTNDAEAFAREKVTGEEAVADLARCVRYIGRALSLA